MAELPVLAAPVDKETLLLYVAGNAWAISVAIVVERKEAGKEYPVQRPVYYISEVLIEFKHRYPIHQLLPMRIPLFGINKDFTDVVNRPLDTHINRTTIIL